MDGELTEREMAFPSGVHVHLAAGEDELTQPSLRLLISCRRERGEGRHVSPSLRLLGNALLALKHISTANSALFLHAMPAACLLRTPD